MNTAEEFWSNVDKSGDCWLWTGAVLTRKKSQGGTGYGILRWYGKTVKAHRLAYELTFGAPSGYVLHSCDNRACVNPAHLREGTHQDNMDDMVRRGRGGGKLTDAQAAVIRQDTRPLKVIAAEYGVAISTVCDIRKGRRRPAVRPQNAVTSQQITQTR